MSQENLPAGRQAMVPLGLARGRIGFLVQYVPQWGVWIGYGFICRTP